MISAGYIGGGDVPAVLPNFQLQPGPLESGQLQPGQGAGPAPQVPGAFQLGGNGIALPVTPVDGSKVDLNKVIDSWDKQNEANRDLAAAQIVGGIFNQFVAWMVQLEWIAAQDSINNRRVEAQENIAKDAKEVNLRYLEITEKSDKRQNGPGGLKERLARIEAEQNIEMYDRKMDAQERIAAQKNLDQAFSYGSDYNYGNPYA